MAVSLLPAAISAGASIFGASQAKKSAKAAAAAAAAAAEQQRQAIETGLKDFDAGVAGMTSNFNTGLGKYDTKLGEAENYLKQLVTDYDPARTRYLDAIGANGQDSQENYFANFQNSPGFAALQKAGVDTISGSKAAGGMLRSGGTLKDLNTYGMRLQNDFFSQELDRLKGAMQAGDTARTNAASLAQKGGSDYLSAYSTLGSKLMDAGKVKLDARTAQGNAAASGTIGGANANLAGDAGSMNYLQNALGKLSQVDFKKLIGGFGGGGGTGYGNSWTPIVTQYA